MLSRERKSRASHRFDALGRDGVAAMEFAMVAPVMLVMIWGVYDISRALIAWEETYHAAQAVAQAAEKMSVTNTTYPGSTQPITSLTSQQMQNAMSSIYVEMPWLNNGTPGGAFNGKYAVTLSGISFVKPCDAQNPPACAPQSPQVLWSSYLQQGGSNLITPLPNNLNSLYRLCSPNPIPWPQFPNNGTQLAYMIQPTMPSGVPNIPQVVADVQFQFKPTFPLLSGTTYTFYASATYPAPLGGDSQAIVFDLVHSDGLTKVEACPGGGTITS